MAIRRYKDEFGAKEDPDPSDLRFCEWRRRQVTDFTRWSTAELLAIKPKLVLSAAVFANFKDSYEERFQDWVAWNKEGILDVTVPMDFAKDNRNVFEPRAAFAATNQWSRAVWLGQGAYANEKENTLNQLLFTRSKGFSGIAFYSYWQPGPFDADGGKAGTNVKTEVIVDNPDAEFEGDWKFSQEGKFFGKDYRIIDRGTAKNYAKYRVKLPASGNYWVDEWHVAGEDKAEDVPFEIRRNGGVTTVKMNQQINGSCWNPIGRFRFETNASVEVRITDASQSRGRIIADAIRFVRIEEEDQTTAAARRANQESVFGYIKEKFQPKWESVPALPWKSNPKSGIILGTVTRNGIPVYNATVRLKDSSEQAHRTEPHGKFAFFEVSPSKHEIEVIFENGFTMKTEAVISAGKVTAIQLNADKKAIKSMKQGPKHK